MFADWEENGSLTDDDKVKRKASFKHPSAVNKIVSDDSIVLQVSDLNAPEYMQTYLKGLQGCDVIRSPLADGEKRAAPVSIEAIGGITTDDPSFDVIGEAAEEEFEYYRRRRKYQDGDDEDVDKWLKKMNRCKKVKICFIIILIVALVITGIALAIHYGAPNAGSMLGSAGASQSSESNSVERFSPIF